MRAIKGLILFCFLTTVLVSCVEEPVFPITPVIDLEKIEFWESPNIEDPDSLVVYINFTDGDGDLGLNGNDVDPPFNPEIFYLDNNNKLITIRTRENPEYADLPPYEFPYTCTNYTESTRKIYFPANVVDKATTNVVDSVIAENVKYYGIQDTIYFERNEDAFNIKVEYFVLENGVFEPFDWVTALAPACGETFDGRFPRLSNESGSLEGTIRYSMKSVGFLPLFSIKPIRLRISIKDRALRTSNVIETEFTLQQIRVN